MEDCRIVELYWARAEQAIVETASKYGKYCYTIAFNILESAEDADECVSDTYMGAWNAIPPHRPSVLSAFLGKITRRLSLKRWRERSAYKRGGGEVPLVLEELAECVPAQADTELQVEQAELVRCIDAFLASLPEGERNLFVRRYWHLDTVGRLSQLSGFSEGKVKTMLYRTRLKLRRHLQREGYL
ncbi:MAG: RNA polymerase sigma factor [Oscillospiraceae bacterium]